MSASDDEYYTVPIKDQRVFGAGLKRKRVAFVPAASLADSLPQSPHLSGTTVAQKYLATVGLAGRVAKSDHFTPREGRNMSSASDVQPKPQCQICKLPLAGNDQSRNTSHEASLAHQVCLQHSHGASHIDRTRKGYTFLQAHGWDADDRKGLGSAGQGRLYPVRATEKRDTAGLGTDVKALKAGKMPVRVEKLNAKQVREAEAAKKKRNEALQRLITANDDVLKYLGELG